MAPQTCINSSAFVLYFPDTVRVAGETIHGRVELNVARAQDEGIENLSVNLKGSIETTIVEPNSDGSNTEHERTVELVNICKPLWDRGTAFPDPGSHSLVFLFQFRLPDNLPPSFNISTLHHKASITYALEVIGRRPGRLLRKDRQIRQVFMVLPTASPAQILARTSLKRGWDGAWKTSSVEQKIRQGIWGDHSHVRAEVQLPDLTSLPRATAFPLKVYIETCTKSMSRTATPFDKHSKPLFPAPPQSAEVKLSFQREANILTRRRKGTAMDSIQLLGGLGDPASSSVQCTAEEPEWVPDPEKEDRGVWKRAVRFETTVSLPFAPTFRTETIECKYSLHFAVSFPGIGNDVKLDVPIRLDPSHAATKNYADFPPAGRPPLLDLPPSYWTLNNVNQQ
ncbi:hypothetical protein B0H16DRAFT_111999 [Mycena metata]|uniref:Arrestin-like N-terminal domain-containing protein n=1 Tax=Mycena metata TaxID=1033252 RepID=A0AAD7MXJ3_9AGAR|nr:hypothetical protein B0H16DRAFT_111999 [Mycena metata]